MGFDFEDAGLAYPRTPHSYRNVEPVGTVDRPQSMRLMMVGLVCDRVLPSPDKPQLPNLVYARSASLEAPSQRWISSTARAR